MHHILGFLASLYLLHLKKKRFDLEREHSTSQRASN